MRLVQGQQNLIKSCPNVLSMQIRFQSALTIAHEISCTQSFTTMPGPEVIKKISCSTKHEISTAKKTKIPTTKEASCFKSLRYCIYHANKC